jgi:hypothetical protein
MVLGLDDVVYNVYQLSDGFDFMDITYDRNSALWKRWRQRIGADILPTILEIDDVEMVPQVPVPDDPDVVPECLLYGIMIPNEKLSFHMRDGDIPLKIQAFIHGEDNSSLSPVDLFWSEEPPCHVLQYDPINDDWLNGGFAGEPMRLASLHRQFQKDEHKWVRWLHALHLDERLRPALHTVFVRDRHPMFVRPTTKSLPRQSSMDDD